MKRTLLCLLLSAGAAAAAPRPALQPSAFSLQPFIVTAYCHCARCCGEANLPAANGRMPQAGVTVAGPRGLPFGTRVHIPGLGVRIVTDRLAHRFNNRFDVFVRSHREALRFGSRTLRVTILK